MGEGRDCSPSFSTCETTSGILSPGFHTPPTQGDVDEVEGTQQRATKMARGWEHLAKGERLREMGFITLSGTGGDGAGLCGGGCWDGGTAPE